MGAHFPLRGRALDDHVADLQRAFEGRVLEPEDNCMDGDLHAVHYLVHIAVGGRAVVTVPGREEMCPCVMCVCVRGVCTCVHVCVCVHVYVWMCVGESCNKRRK